MKEEQSNHIHMLETAIYQCTTVTRFSTRIWYSRADGWLCITYQETITIEAAIVDASHVSPGLTRLIFAERTMTVRLGGKCVSAIHMHCVLIFIGSITDTNKMKRNQRKEKLCSTSNNDIRLVIYVSACAICGYHHSMNKSTMFDIRAIYGTAYRTDSPLIGRNRV